MTNVYLDLTAEFNAGRLRAVICSGQAVVLHRLAVVSKDGDWILREDDEAIEHVLRVLARHGARYRFGAPLALPWLRGGWSSHFDFMHGELRVRTDFFSRPPRVTTVELARVWREQELHVPPFVDVRVLAELKKTNREKDYVVIGELARLMTDVRDQLLYSRSARDLIELSARHPQETLEVAAARPLLRHTSLPRHELQRELDAEKALLIDANEARLARFLSAAEPWSAAWPALEREVAGMELLAAHEVLVRRAKELLPVAAGGAVEGTADGAVEGPADGC